MDSSDKFNSIEDLYKRILPALNTKVSTLKREKILNISSQDIWRYCIQVKWKNKTDLRIYEMIDDILNLDVLELKNKYNDKE